MKILLNKFLIAFSFIHRVCPLCVISRKWPQSKFAKIVSLWSEICPCCNIYFLARKRKLI
ncbi:MAG: hypothetical protein AMJ95_06740 [Omnitrophica WOR_2 bacterium SM23_72]|nr:MAG: hypothetical protein AMJ95_06740 [Omnitrophica WOR_2 bacterium SM23_72]